MKIMFNNSFKLLTMLFLTVGLSFTLTSSVFSEGLHHHKKKGKDKGSFCSSAKAKLEANWTLEDCFSPIANCTAGKVYKGGFLNGETYYTAMDASYGAGLLSEPLSTVSYAGEFMIKTKHGSLFFTDVGFMEGAYNVFSEVDRVVSGTGRFEGATGLLFISGDVTATGFSGVITGEICLAK